jgi:outer membrane biosynthesis protein TonB
MASMRSTRPFAILLLSLCSACTATPVRSPEPTRDDDPPARASERDEALPTRESGRRTAQLTNRVIRKHRARFRACYDAARKGSPALAGKVELAFTIAPDGVVKRAEVDEGKSTLLDEGLSACLVETVSSIRFPEAAEEVGSRMHYPFDFQPGGGKQ